MAKPLIQLALDSLDYQQTLKLASQAAEFVDCIEIGTPCLKYNGLGLLKELRNLYPTKTIFVDLKTMDAGQYEATPFFKAGADITTVLGTADIDTIKGVIAAANAHGKMAQVDLINVENKPNRARESVQAGAHIIGIHTGIDQQLAGQTPFADLQALLSLRLGAKISVAGGINKDTIAQVVRAGADIVVVGGAITGAKNPTVAAREIREAVDAAAS
ncbi:MAG: 3-hexulose-6-phosphate synthase [Pseudomonadota bacterium]|jgi:3-hexulose-6-phosphate synthase